MTWIPVEIQPLLIAASTIGVAHTLLGADHYLPFIAIARERSWSNNRTLSITAICGIGHCASSVALGMLGIATGITLGSLIAVESERGAAAAWLLIAFGVTYACWSYGKSRRRRKHSHRHVHADGTIHTHRHSHGHAHLHTHARQATRPLLMTLFVVFLLGPCEPLIPLLMYPAAQSSLLGVVAVATVFCTATIVTMLIVVFAGLQAAEKANFSLPTNLSGVVTGGVIGLCGFAMIMGL